MLSLGGLASQQEGYFVLHQGQPIEIDLETLIPANALDIKLKINGYYEILQDNVPAAQSSSGDREAQAVPSLSLLSLFVRNF